MSTRDEQDFDRTLKNALKNTSQWRGSPHAMFHKVRRTLQPKPWYQRLRPVFALGATALSLMLVLGIYYHAQINPIIPNDQPLVIDNDESPAIPTASLLPVVGTTEKLRELVSELIYLYGLDEGGVGGSPDLQARSSVKSSYSETNTQVQGVDEADIIKTDGTYLYQIRGQEITISKISPETAMRVESRIVLPEMTTPQEIYVDAQYLTIIVADAPSYAADEVFYRSRMWYPTNTRILVYNITNKQRPVQVREIDVEGSAVSTRKVGSVVYLVAQKWLNSDDLEGESTVYYRDSINGAARSEIGLDRICYFPENLNNAYLTVLALDVSDGRKEATVEVYLGSGRNIFMSQDNLYIALEQWNQSNESNKAYTLVHKFSVAGTNLTYQGMGQIPGNILNQFSMDEHNGYFRIATTSHEAKTLNNVYILDRNMKVVGTLEGLAPGEQIYSVRFMGDKGYLVTFEMIDPLFVIDLKNPTNPQVLGELKIPGFSNYLHPIDENTLLGIGRDTDVVMRNGRPAVQEKGMKLAIFDVSDVNNPEELHVEIIGGYGSYSEALYNHKAVLFYRDVLSLPVSVMESGKLEFEGAVAYHVSKEYGFAPMGKVTHHNDRDLAIGDHGGYISRTLIANNVFYSISQNMIKANRLTGGLPELATLSLK
jgi:uncharacterized secreted protein with C-terminal beta-propeller domain